MSTDIVINAFRVLRAENPVKGSKVVVVLDLRPDFHRRVLSFLGTSSRDIENTSFWNGVFRSHDRTEQSATIRPFSPSSLKWTGVGIAVSLIETARKSLALQLEEVQTIAKELAREIQDFEASLEKKKDLQVIQKLESTLSKKVSNDNNRVRVETELGFIATMLQHVDRQTKKVPAPVIMPGHSQVDVKYYRRTPASQQHLTYFVDAVARTKCSWESLTMLAPANALEGVEPKYKALPMPDAVASVLIEAQKIKGEEAPRASASRWTPPQRLAYAWFCVILSYNHTWGAFGIVPLPKRVKTDKRFAVRAAAAGPRSGKPARPKVEDVDVESVVERVLKNLLAAHLPKPEEPKKVDSLKESEFSSEVRRITNVYANATAHLVSDKRSADPTRTLEAEYVVSRIKGLLELWSCTDVRIVIESWAYYADLDGAPETTSLDRPKESEEGLDYEDSWKQGISVKRFLNPDEIRSGGIILGHPPYDPESSTGSLTPRPDKGKGRLVEEVSHSSGNDPRGPDDVLHEQAILSANADDLGGDAYDRAVPLDVALATGDFAREERQRFLAADAVNHNFCNHEAGFCSLHCPILQAGSLSDIYGPLEFVYDEGDRNTPEPRQEQPEAGPSGTHADDDSSRESQPSAARTTHESYATVGDFVFHRADGDARSLVGCGETSLVLPDRGAFLCTVDPMTGGIYINTDLAVILPKPSGEGQNSLSGLKVARVPREKDVLDQVVNEAPEEIREYVRQMSDYSSVRSIFPAPAEAAAPNSGKPTPPPVNMATKPKGSGQDKKKASKKTTKETSKSAPAAPAQENKAKSLTPKEKTKTKDKRFIAAFKDWDLSQKHEALGDGPTSSDATIDGLKKAEWSASHLEEITKGPNDQAAGCTCDTFPCRHTKTNVANRIRSGRDLAWNLAFSSAGGKTAAKSGAKAGASTDPTEKKDPLRVKNLPRSNQLNESQKASLRKHFGLADEISPEVWSAMSKDERAKHRGENSIPRWATACVIRDEHLLGKILDKSLDKGAAVELLKTKPPRATETSAAHEWTKLKARFEGVSLLFKPRTGKEKAFKKSFDSLSRKYPNNPSLPKPRKGRGDEGGRMGKNEQKDRPKQGKPMGSPSTSKPSDELSQLIKLMMVKMIGKMAE